MTSKECRRCQLTSQGMSQRLQLRCEWWRTYFNSHFCSQHSSGARRWLKKPHSDRFKVIKYILPYLVTRRPLTSPGWRMKGKDLLREKDEVKKLVPLTKIDNRPLEIKWHQSVPLKSEKALVNRVRVTINSLPVAEYNVYMAEYLFP